VRVRGTRTPVRTAAVAGVAAVAAAGLGATVAARGGGIREGGPLVAPAEHGFAMPKRVGAVFADGVETLELTGTRSAVLKKVEVVGTDGLQVVGVSMVRPGRKVGTIQELDGWPPRDPDLRPGDVVTHGIGARFTPTRSNPRGQSYELLVGLRVAKAGYLVRDGLRVTYSVDGVDYQRYFPAQLAVCTSQRHLLGDGSCPIPEE